jgi:phage gp36-like protein
MSYATATQVQEEFSGVTFSTTSSPTLATVERWLLEADAVIESALGLRYVVPITGTNSLVVVRNIEILLVRARVRKRLNRIGQLGDAERKVYDDDTTNAMKMLKALAEGTMNLGDATLLNSDGGIASFPTVDTCDAYVFKKNVDQW